MFPDHVEATIRSIRRLYAEHHENSTRQQRATAWMTARIGSAAFLAVLAAVIAAWICVNLLI